MLNNRNFTFNGVVISNYVTVERVIRGLYNRAIDWAGFTSRPDFVLQARDQSKTTTVEFRAIEDDFESLAALELTLAPFLVSNDIARLELYDRPGKHDMAIIESVDWERARRTGFGKIVFRSPYPYMFGQEKTESFTLAADQQASITITGTAPVEPVIRITGFTADESATIILTTQSDALELNYNPSAGSIIVIDNENGDVKFGNGTTAMPYLTLASKWVKWDTGARTFSVNRACTVQITYTERWIG